MRLKTVTLICVLIIGSVIASQDGPALGGIEKPRKEVPQEQPSGPQELIAGQEGEPSGVIMVKSKLPKQEQPSGAQGGPGKNVLLKNVDEIASLENSVKIVGENEELLKALQAAKEELRKNAFNKDIGTDESIFEAIMVAKGKSLSFLFEIASPKVLGDLAKQNKRPKIKEWAEGAIKIYEKLEQSIRFQGSFDNNNYNGIIELIGGITTFGVEFTQDKLLTDDSATPAVIRLTLNNNWLTQRFRFRYNVLTQKAKSKHLALEEAYNQRAEWRFARHIGIAPRKDGRYPIRGVSEHIASFLQSRPIENVIITEPPGRIKPSILEPFKVHLKEGIPKEIIGLAAGKGQAKGSKLNNEQVKQIRPYSPALVTYIFENKLDIEKFLYRTGLYSDYETFVAFMDVYGLEIRMGSIWSMHRRVFRKFEKALSSRHMVNALFRVRNFYAALYLYAAIPREKSFTMDRLRFLAKVTQFPFDAFPIVMQVRRDGGLFERRAFAIRARCLKNIRDAAEKNNLDYLRKHLLDGNVTYHGLGLILEHGSKVPIEAFKLILSVASYPIRTFSHITPVQCALAEDHTTLYDQLENACAMDNLESIGVLLVNPNCTPGMRVDMFLRYPRHGTLVEDLIPGNCDLILAKWMNWEAPRSAELDAVINPCLQHYAAKHEKVKSP